jgi:uncharacterized membrane protein (DUF2068 family)
VQAPSRDRPLTLLIIALFKLTKGVLLLIVGIGALKLLHRDVADTVAHWVDLLRVDPENRHIHRLLEHLINVTPAQLRAASAGTFIYSGLLLTEGVGLLLRKRWAEYFTIITTAGLIPIEIYELARHVTAVKILVFVINVAIVAYLIARVNGSRREGRRPVR